MVIVLFHDRYTCLHDSSTKQYMDIMHMFIYTYCKCILHICSYTYNNSGVPTTRALSLIVSETKTTQRPWFTSDRQIITVDDKRLQGYSADEKKSIVRQVNSEPDSMIRESVAIACRVGE